MKRAVGFLVLSIAAGAPARAQAPAVRVGDATSHGGLVVGPGVATVLIGGRAAAAVGDLATCPQVDGSPPVAHVGGPVVTGSATVFVGGRRAARAGDLVAESGPSAALVAGAPTVLIGP